MNDPTCVVLTPLVIEVWASNPPQLGDLDLGVCLLAVATSSNIGAALTPIGSPQNLLIFGAAAGKLTFVSFLQFLILPVAVCLLANVFLLYALAAMKARHSSGRKEKEGAAAAVEAGAEAEAAAAGEAAEAAAAAGALAGMDYAESDEEKQARRQCLAAAPQQSAQEDLMEEEGVKGPRCAAAEKEKKEKEENERMRRGPASWMDATIPVPRTVKLSLFCVCLLGLLVALLLGEDLGFSAALVAGLITAIDQKNPAQLIKR